MLRLVVGILAILLLTSGCTLFENIGLGGGVRVPGQVTFYDTGIGVKAWVTVNRSFSTSSTGSFIVSLPEDQTVAWKASTLVGEASDSFTPKRGSRLDIRIPAFDGWDRRHYNEVLITPEQRATVRWPDGHTVRYWIDSDPRAGNSARSRAKSAISEWSHILQGTVTFSETSNRSQADLQVMWADSAVHGACERYWDGRTGLLFKGIVTIAYSQANVDGLYRHEIGHCIGLNHSSDPSFNMYPETRAHNQAISATERNLTKLLYAAAPNTGRLEGLHAFAVAPEPGEIIRHPDGTITEIIH